MQFIFRIPSRFMTVFLDLILVSQFTMRYYLENPSLKGVGILPFVVFEFRIYLFNKIYLIICGHWLMQAYKIDPKITFDLRNS